MLPTLTADRVRDIAVRSWNALTSTDLRRRAIIALINLVIVAVSSFTEALLTIGAAFAEERCRW